MRTVLAIVGCGPRLEVALAAPGMSAPALVALAGPTPRSDLIVAAVDLLLRSAALASDAIEAVAASRGPGSFTGLRVALATAQGLALARGLPAHGFPSLAVQAARTSVRPCLAAQPARRGHVWVQRFESAEPDGAASPLAASPLAVAALADLVASDVPVVAAVGVELPPGTPVASAPRTAAEALLALAHHHVTFDASTLLPLYAEPPQAEPPATPRLAWQRSPRAS